MACLDFLIFLKAISAKTKREREGESRSRGRRGEEERKERRKKKKERKRKKKGGSLIFKNSVFAIAWSSKVSLAIFQLHYYVMTPQMHAITS